MIASGDVAVELIKGSGSAFEITLDGQLVFSKKELGRFPTDQELDAILAT